MKNEHDFWVIGIGASAGGLEALSAFFRVLPDTQNACFIVAQHLAPHARSMMVELISRQASLPVIPVADNLKIKAGEIYIVPPNHDVAFEGNELKMTMAGNETRPKPSVDHFFESLAKTFGRKAVGIILSGTGSDGTEGIRFIKENNGVTLVQDSTSAKYDGMPKSAYETGLIDAVLPPEEMAEKLFSILENRDEVAPLLNKTDKVDLPEVLKYLKNEIGTDFSQYKISTIQRRMEKRIAKLNLGSLKEYYKYLKTNRSELANLAQEMLVSVTSFFRDPEAFEALREYLKQIILKKNPGEELRVWSAGCATGEEPYTLAFIISNLCRESGKSIPVKIFATDLDHEALGVARSGIYSPSDLEGLSAGDIEDHFDIKDTQYEVKKVFRDMIVFAKQDLVQNPPFVKLDLVVCRNVLIYFDQSLQNRIFDIFHYALKTGGILFLGKSESVNANLFDSLDKKNKIFKKLNVLSHFSTPHRYSLNQNAVVVSKPKTQAGSNISELAMTQVVNYLNMAGVVVDDESTVIHLLGRISEYISLPTGHADFRLLNLLPKHVSVEFMVLLRKAVKTGELIKSRSFKLDKKSKKSFVFSIQPLEDLSENSRPLYLVIFESKKLEVQPIHSIEDTPRRVLELEQELAASKENLQTVIEELEISNEELQSLNEELSSTNEELQASNEELETTNEELQSTNEELTTLNEELNIKTSELRITNVSFENILTSITSPILVVDREARLLRYNSSTNQVFHLTYTDVGRPIMQASCHCEISNFEEAIFTTVQTGKISELKCTSMNRAYQIRIHPNRDENNTIIGAIIVFFDNTDFMASQVKLASSEKRIRAIVDGTPALIFLKDAQGKYLTANGSFMEKLGINEDQLIGKTDRDFFDEETSNQLRDNDLEILFKREKTGKEETIKFKDKTYTFYSNRFPLFENNERNPYAIGTVAIDISELVHIRDELKVNESRYKAIIEDQAVFVCRHTLEGHFTFTNRAFCNFFGGTDQSNKARTFLSMIDKADREKVSHELSKLDVDSPIVQYEHRIVLMPDVPPRWVRWIHRAIFDDQNNIREYQAVGFDVTEIHNKTAELLAKESVFSHVLEHTSDFLSVYKLQHDELVLESFNQSSNKYKSLGQNRFVGIKLKKLIDDPEILNQYELCLKERRIITFNEEIPGPGGARYLSNTLVPVADENSSVFRIVVISRDITQLKRTENALREEKHKADAANKAKSDFLASMSHELRTPLNVIMGMSQLLSRSNMKPEHVKFVESISRSSKVLLSLIEDVLDLSKIEAGKINFDHNPFSLNTLVDDVMDSFQSTAKQKGIELLREDEFSSDLIVVGDQVRLKQILINLLGNAIKFTDQGSVTLKTQVLSDVSTTAQSIYFEVKDTGIGIEQESFHRIFKRFSQADSGSARKFGGTGLGLAISKQLVELMNGSIGFDSEKGKGSTFWFQIQLQKSTTTHLNEQDDKSITDLKDFKIMVVDDNIENLRVLKLMLEETGAEIIAAQSGYEALDGIKNKDLDIILMDMQMPELDGLETTRRLRAFSDKKNKIPVIALTANAMPGDREKCLEAGMNDYATKPVDLNLLQKMIKKWARK